MTDILHVRYLLASIMRGGVYVPDTALTQPQSIHLQQYNMGTHTHTHIHTHTHTITHAVCLGAFCFDHPLY